MRRRIAVLMGGVSQERDVSLKSGKAVADALRSKGHDVVEVDILDETIGGVIEAKPDVAFVALHGRFGEDGGIQSLLDQANIAYTGSDPQASRAGMDKMASKCFFITHDVPTPPFRLVTTTQQWAQIDAAVREAGLPLVVKPLRQGSSIGVSLARSVEDVAIGLAKAFKYGHQALLERYIQGREFTVGVLDETALPVIEIKHKREFFDIEAKYGDETERALAPEITAEQKEKMQEIAVAAHRAIGCRHLSRVDIMLESDGCMYVLEVNTIPGFTDHSLFPMAAKASGIEFPELCERIAEMALVSAHAAQVNVGHQQV